ncbi:hypothetical protein L6452_37450 [Arctium lappa]|uniref:Uncharacterized protein n=1 Tax=Arctium lappa TaxID=4217 RepID=A0ACB8Y291_ARCLA|nr:hypothetical protein L6452_37450 [Arctium lappa]
MVEYKFLMDIYLKAFYIFALSMMSIGHNSKGFLESSFHIIFVDDVHLEPIDDFCHNSPKPLSLASANMWVVLEYLAI